MDNIVIELFLLSIGASFVQRTTGFGFGIFIMTMLPSIMPSFGEATTLSGILAMTQTYFLAGNLMMTLARAYNGFFTTTVSIGYVYGIAGVFIGNLIGSWVFRHLSGSLLKYIIYAYIGISGLTFLLGA